MKIYDAASSAMGETATIATCTAQTSRERSAALIDGVVKGVTIHAIRVLDCSGFGSFPAVIAGVDWVTAKHLSLAIANWLYCKRLWYL